MSLPLLPLLTPLRLFVVQRNAIRSRHAGREPLGQRTIRGTLNVRSEDAEDHVEVDSGSEYVDEDDSLESESQ